MKTLNSVLILAALFANCQATFAKPKKATLRIPTAVYGVTIQPKAGHFPKCEGTRVTRADFRILTLPRGYEEQVTLSPVRPDGSLSNSWGVQTVTASINGKTNTASYIMEQAGTYVPGDGGGGFPLPKASPAVTLPMAYSTKTTGWSSIHQKYQWYETKVIWSLGVDWIHIDSIELPGGASQAKIAHTSKWNIDIGAEGKGTVQFPFLAGVGLTVDLGGGWESVDDRQFSYGPGKAPYYYRFKRYQKVAPVISRQVYARYAYGDSMTAPPDPLGSGWSDYINSGFSGKASWPNVGYDAYRITEEKRCY